MNLAIKGEKRMGAMHDDDEELALNAKAIGLAIGGAIVAGLLFVLARRDDKKPAAAIVEGAADAVVEEVKHSSKEAKNKQKALKKAAEKHAREAARHAKNVVSHAESDARNAEREMKAAAWDALQEAQEAEGRLRSASGRVVGDAAHLASKLTHEAKNLAGEGKGRLDQFRHREDIEFSAQEEIVRLREELENLRQRSSGGRSARQDLSALATKITKNSGLDPNSAAASALAVGLDHLEKSLKAKAPELLAARDRRQVSALLQSELGPVLRDSLIQGATAALNSWEVARSATAELPRPQAQALKAAVAEAPKHVARVMHRSESDAPFDPNIAANVEDRSDEVVEKIRPLIGERAPAESPDPEETLGEPETNLDQTANGHHGKAGWLWGAAGLGLAVYALADSERREQFLKLANDATILAQELLRDLRGYDDEFA